MYHECFQFEHSILLLNSPKIIISEGIANLALNSLYSYRDQAEISFKEFCRKEAEEDSLDKIIKQFSVKRKIDLFLYNLAYHAIIDEWSKKQLFRYATSFEIFSKENIENHIKRLYDPVYSTTTFSYFIGPNLIINKYGEFPSVDNFYDLLSKPVLPSDLI